MSGIFKAYDIRGIYPTEINENVAYAIGRAYVEFTKARKVVIGRDMRPHSEEMFRGISRGIMDQGADVIDLGLSSTAKLLCQRHIESRRQCDDNRQPQSRRMERI